MEKSLLNYPFIVSFIKPPPLGGQDCYALLFVTGDLFTTKQLPDHKSEAMPTEMWGFSPEINRPFTPQKAAIQNILIIEIAQGVTRYHSER